MEHEEGRKVVNSYMVFLFNSLPTRAKISICSQIILHGDTRVSYLDPEKFTEIISVIHCSTAVLHPDSEKDLL